MKRIGFLYEKIGHPDNLRLAFVKAARGKSDRKEVITFRSSFEENISKMAQQFNNEKLALGRYHFFKVRDPKQRDICAAPFAERIIHHAIMNHCEPVFDTFAIHDSYACRPGKGLRRAIKRCRDFTARNSWFLKLDVHKYFDSIDQEIALHQLARLIKDKKLLNLFKSILCTYSTASGKGVPIGNLISQHIANYYLGYFDHWIKEERKVKHYLRYMDDFVLFASSKNRLQEHLHLIHIFLEDTLKIKVKNDIHLNRCMHGVHFLGFRVFPHRVRLSPRSKQRFREKFRRYEYLYRQGTWTEEKLSEHITPLIEFTRNSDAFMFRKNVIQRYGGSF